MNKKPTELHAIQGTKGVNQGISLPEKVKMRIPECEWMHNPNAWNPEQFFKETSDYLYDVYGIGSSQERHLLAWLTKEISKYIECEKHLNKGLVVNFNNGATWGANPYLSIQERALSKALQIMNELGLTPRSRLSGTKAQSQTNIGKLMLGPQIKR